MYSKGGAETCCSSNFSNWTWWTRCDHDPFSWINIKFSHHSYHMNTCMRLVGQLVIHPQWLTWMLMLFLDVYPILSPSLSLTISLSCECVFYYSMISPRQLTSSIKQIWIASTCLDLDAPYLLTVQPSAIFGMLCVIWLGKWPSTTGWLLNITQGGENGQVM